MKSLNTDIWNSQKYEKESYFISNYLLKYPLNDHRFLLMNGLSGAVDIVSKTEYEEIFQRKHFERYAEQVKQLTERGYFFIDENHEIKFKEDIYLKTLVRQKSSEAVVCICPSDYCSMQCNYCYTHNYTKSREVKSMSGKVVDIVMLEASKLLSKNSQNKFITLYGGEPFQLHTQPAIARIFNNAVKYGLTIAGFTNGYYLENFQDLLLRYKEHFEVLSLTLDGTKDTHNSKRALKNSFQKTESSIDLLINLNIPVQILTNIDGENLNVDPLISFYKEKGWWENPSVSFELNPIRRGLKQVDKNSSETDLLVHIFKQRKINNDYFRFGIAPLLNAKYHLLNALGVTNISENDLPETTRVPKVFHCPAVSGKFSLFDSNGQLYLCNEDIGEIGKIFGTMENASMNYKQEEMGVYQNRDFNKINQCTTCKLAFFCGGGCACYAKSLQSPSCQISNDDFRKIIHANELGEI